MVGRGQLWSSLCDPWEAGRAAEEMSAPGAQGRVRGLC